MTLFSQKQFNRLMLDAMLNTELTKEPHFHGDTFYSWSFLGAMAEYYELEFPEDLSDSDDDLEHNLRLWVEVHGGYES